MIRRWPSGLAALAWAVALGAPCASAAPAARKAFISCDASVAPVVFAAEEIRKALEAKGYTVAVMPLANQRAGGDGLRFVIQVTPDKNDAVLASYLGAQAYGIDLTTRGNETYRVFGTDAAGAMYGGLDLAEQIALHRKRDFVLAIGTHRPAIARRGIKFNIPLDARTPSYDDTGDAAQKNIVEMWNFAFWREFLDDMARHRYNTLTLWNPHPFPSIVTCPNYPKCALDDVCVPTIKPEYRSRSWREPQFVSPKVLANLKVIRKMTMDEKIAFWRRVIAHARGRGIDVYWITWNVLVNSAEGKYGITAAQDNPKTIAYIRECVRQTLLTYPGLRGIGVTAGEHMRNRKDEYDREKWLWAAYGAGVMDVRKLQPKRQVRFIHRVWNSGMGPIVRDFASKYDGPFEVGFKYARARLYSSTSPPFCKDLLRELAAHKVRCWWNLRNDDIFNFRWGDPDYVRAFLKNLPPKHLTAGYHMGSDGYVWAREHTSTEPDSPRQLEIRKHWYRFMLWGRLGYDPTLGREFFEKKIAARLGKVDAAKLYDAWQAASKIIPQVNRFHWRNWDFMWAVEICSDQRKGFHTVDDFISCDTMAGSGLVSIRDYVAQDGRGAASGKTPPDVAGRLDAWAAAALRSALACRPRRTVLGKESRLTLADIEAMSHLGHYYAAKIRGALALAQCRKGRGAEKKTEAVKHLTDALGHWKRYAETASKHYEPQLLARTRRTDWHKITRYVEADVKIARDAK